MIFQDFTDLYLLTPVLSILILFVLMGLMVFFYTRHAYMFFLPILSVFLFSLVIGVSSIAESNIPFTPYFQMFFLLIQTVFFMLHTFEFFKN